jgi:hypothetical protein
MDKGYFAFVFVTYAMEAGNNRVGFEVIRTVNMGRGTGINRKAGGIRIVRTSKWGHAVA